MHLNQYEQKTRQYEYDLQYVIEQFSRGVALVQ